MATTGNLQLTSPSSPSSSSPSTWDVFLSFYGKDTRRNFTSHLYSALDQAGILTFRDDPALEKGEDISRALLAAIHASKMFVVVISENYARSPWCLNELVEILSCQRTESQVVPVFYYVDPSDLRYNKRSFGEAFESHEKLYSVNRTEKWKSALAQISNLSGYHLKKHAAENESETIQNIIENVARQVSTKVIHIGDDLFGIDSALEEIYQKLRMESNDVRAIGICGMGGIGKTTTALAFYNKYSNRFDISCFIEKVKQYSRGGSPLLPLLKQLLTALLRRKDYKVPDVDTGIRQLKQILYFKKALIVLDDLDQSSCSEFLVRHCNLFSAGSRIIITTRDVNLPNQLKVNISDVDIYMVKELGPIDSLELFSYHAFGEPTPPASFKELSVNFVTYAGGLPLALKVLGSSSLRGRHDVLFWKAKLEKVKEIPEKGILEILQVSYNELDDETLKSIFLDIAFFFVGKYESDAVEIFKSCDFHPEVGIPILLERCLLTIDEKGIFQMHDLIQDMGRKLGKSTRLFLRGNAWEDLQNQKELDQIEGLILDMTRSMEKQINSQIFEKLPRLRLLEIFDVSGIEGDLKNSFNELRCIYWSYCTWTQLPSTFRPRNIVSLHMPFSSFNILWNDTKPFMKLKTIDVSDSVKLKTTPNFGDSKLVERLFFGGCESLVKLHPSIRELTGLYVLDLAECTHLKELAGPIGKLSTLGHYTYSSVRRSPKPMKQWGNMGYLYLGYCINLNQLPKQLGDMKCLKWLDASHTAIEQLPDSITQLKGLFKLELSDCKKLKKLPEQIGNMDGLRTFSASCTAIEQLPDSFVYLINLEILDLRYCKNLRYLPNSIWKLKLLKLLYLGKCSKLERLPEQLGKMKSLERLYASSTAIEEAPDSIGQLSRLQVLDLSYCENLKHVPDSVWNLPSLAHLYLLQTDIGRINWLNTVKNTKLFTLSLNCDIRSCLSMILNFSSLQRLVLRDDGENLTEPFSLSKLYNLQYLELNDCASFGSSFLELPPNLTHLSLCNHATLVHLPNLSSLKQLKQLDIIGYHSLESLPALPPHLQSLMVYDCKSLQDQPDMSILKDLVSLSFGRYSNPKAVTLKQSFLQVPRQYLPLFKADVPKIAQWFSYKTSGRTLSFAIPPLLGDDFLGLALWVLFTSKNNYYFNIRAVVTNKTKGVTKSCEIPVYCIRGTEVYSLVRCFGGNEISIGTGDRIEILFLRQLYSYRGQVELPNVEGKVEMCAAHLIQKTALTPDFPSVLNNLINGP